MDFKKAMDKAICTCDEVSKSENFRSLYKEVRKIAENGTLEQLVEFRNKLNAINSSGGLTKGDYKILLKNDLEAERSITRRKKNG